MMGHTQRAPLRSWTNWMSLIYALPFFSLENALNVGPILRAWWPPVATRSLRMGTAIATTLPGARCGWLGISVLGKGLWAR